MSLKGSLSPHDVVPNDGEMVISMLIDDQEGVLPGLYKLIYHNNNFLDKNLQEVNKNKVYRWKPTGLYKHPFKQAKRMLVDIINDGEKLL